MLASYVMASALVNIRGGQGSKAFASPPVQDFPVGASVCRIKCVIRALLVLYLIDGNFLWEPSKGEHMQAPTVWHVYVGALSHAAEDSLQVVLEQGGLRTCKLPQCGMRPESTQALTVLHVLVGYLSRAAEDFLWAPEQGGPEGMEALQAAQPGPGSEGSTAPSTSSSSSSSSTASGEVALHQQQRIGSTAACSPHMDAPAGTLALPFEPPHLGAVVLSVPAFPKKPLTDCMKLTATNKSASHQP
eukprot:scaffold29281_cov22-Tisochrysis_lutea.AAC.1